MDNVQHINILNQPLTNLNSKAVQFQTTDGTTVPTPQLKKLSLLSFFPQI
jgi:hypothetical protein